MENFARWLVIGGIIMIVISTGLTIGSLSGGYLAQHVGLYAPYWFAIMLVGLGMAGHRLLNDGGRCGGGLSVAAAARAHHL